MVYLLATHLPAQTTSVPGKDYSEKDFTKRDMKKMDLLGANFEGAILYFADFSGMNLTGVSFKDANLTGAKFTGADLTGVDLRGALVKLTRFTDANMTRVNASGLQGSSLDRMDIGGAKSYREADFRNSDLRGSGARGDFRGANFCGARLVDVTYMTDRSQFQGALYDGRTRWAAGFDPVAAGAVLVATGTQSPAKADAPLAQKKSALEAKADVSKRTVSNPTGEDLHGKSLVGVDLRMRNLRGGNLQDADLSRADLTDTDLQGADFRNANLTSTRLDKADLTGADLRGANLLRTRLRDTKLIEANLEGQKLYLAGAAATFQRPAGVSSYGLEGTVNLSNGMLTFRGANLRNAQVFGSLDGVDLRKADLRGANFSEARDLDKARLTGARYDAKTRWAFDPSTSGAELVQDQGELTAAAAEAVPLYWLMGRWNLVPVGAEAEPGVLNLNGNRTYTWTSSKDQSVVKGLWRKATDMELHGVTGDCVVLQKGERDLDWLVAKQGSVLGGEDEIQLKASDESRKAVRRNALPSS